MSQIDFAEALWRKQNEYFAKRADPGKLVRDRFDAFQKVFDYFEKGQTVAQIACGGIMKDLFYTMARVGKDGRIILIDEDPTFPYQRAVSVVGEDALQKGGNFYVHSAAGRAQIAELFAQANVHLYAQRLPPYPQQIPDSSIDHVMAINAAFELMSTRVVKGEPRRPPDFEGLIVETHRKLRPGGSFIVQGLMDEDIYVFGQNLELVAEKHGLALKEDYPTRELEMGNIRAAGYWRRWIKQDKS